MTHQLSTQETQRLITAINIPSKPAILIQLAAEVAQPDVNVRRLGELIAHDLGLAAAVLRSVNSPLFGLRARVGSIHQAVAILGTRNITQIVTCQALRRELPETKVLRGFWEEAEHGAGSAAFIAGSCRRGQKDEVYSFGMLHDVGMLLMSRKFPDYGDTLRAATDRPLTEVEDQRHSTNHAVVGHLVGRAWGLPEAMCEGILHHHELMTHQESEEATPESLQLVAIAILAERLAAEAEWGLEGEEACAVLALPRERLATLGSEVAAMS